MAGPSPRNQVNAITSFLDGSNVYGSSDEEALNLRTLSGGLLKVHSKKETCSQGSSCPYSFLPYATENFDSDAPFLAGDGRVNEQPGLTSMHTLFVRFHNKLATKLAQASGITDDEIIYQVS